MRTPRLAAGLALPVAALAALLVLPTAGGPVAAPPPIDPNQLAPVADIAPNPGAAASQVRVFGFNDFHGQLNSPGRLGATANEPVGTQAGGSQQFYKTLTDLRGSDPNTATVAAGDLLGASQIQSALFDDEPSLLTYSKFGVDFAGVGNHEFDEGRADLERKQNGGCTDSPAEDPPQACQFADPTRANSTAYPGTTMRYLSANVTVTATGNPLFPAFGIKTFANGDKVGFIGVTLEATPSIVSQAGIAGLTFGDEADAANSYVQQIKDQGARTIALLIHQGGTQNPANGGPNPVTPPSTQPPATYSGIDTCANFMGADLTDVVSRLSNDIKIVISGHSHQAYNCSFGSGDAAKLVTSANFGGRVISDITLSLASDGTLATASAVNRLVRNDNTQATGVDATYDDVKALADAALSQSASRRNRVIGTITGDLTRAASRAGESVLGDRIADAQLRASDATRAPSASAVIAFMNPGGIRTDLLRNQISGGEAIGEVTFGESFNVQPFGNNLTTKTFTGAQIERLLEQQYQGCFGQRGPGGRILQVSQGFSYVRDDSRPTAAAPGCDRIDPTTIRLNGVTLNPAMSYRVTMNSFLADGGDDFTTFRDGTDAVGGPVDTVALEDFFKANPNGVTPTNRDRVGFVPAPAPQPVIPEVPLALVLPLLAVGLAGGTTVLVARRRRDVAA